MAGRSLRSPAPANRMGRLSPQSYSAVRQAWNCRGLLQAYLDRRRPGSNRHRHPRREGDKVVILSGLYHPEHDLLLGDAQVSTTVDGEFAQAAQLRNRLHHRRTHRRARSLHRHPLRRLRAVRRPARRGAPRPYRPGQALQITGACRRAQRRPFELPFDHLRRDRRVRGARLPGQAVRPVILSSICQVGPLRAERTHTAAAASGRAPTESSLFPPSRLTPPSVTSRPPRSHSLDAEFASEAAQLIKQARIEGDSWAQPSKWSPSTSRAGGRAALPKPQGAAHGRAGRAERRPVLRNRRRLRRRPSPGATARTTDPIRTSGYQSNSHGGLIGGITTGMPLVCRVGFKPTSTIVKSRSSPYVRIWKRSTSCSRRAAMTRASACAPASRWSRRLAIELMNAVLMTRPHTSTPHTSRYSGRSHHAG